MNILYLAHRIPYPPNKGEKIRSFNQVQQLAQHHTVHVACLVDEREDWPHVQTLGRYCASVTAVYRDKTIAILQGGIKALLSNNSLSVACFYSRALQREIDRKLASERFDRIFVSCSSMAPYVQRVTTIPKIIDLVDVDSDKWRLYADLHTFPLSWLYRSEAMRLAKYEELVARGFNQIVFVSAKEAELFRRRVADRPLAVVPNGVDQAYFSGGDQETRSAGPPVLVFVGAMDYFPNVDAVRYFCAEIFPVIRAAVPEVRFYIVGRNPTRRVKKLVRLPQVVVTGAVDDIRPYLTQAWIAVAPFRLARGLQNKVLEAMAMGRPVVGSSQAFQGLQATVADGIQVADQPRQFAEVVVNLLLDAEARKRCVALGQQYVRRFHRWQQHGAELEWLLQRVGQRTVSVPVTVAQAIRAI